MAKKNKGRTKLAVAALTLVGVSATVGLLSLCKAENINLVSIGHYSAEEIITAMDIEFGESLALVDTNEIAKSIEESFPYIETARVSKVLPSTINVEIVDGIPIASVEYEGAYVYVSESGKILEISETVSPNTTVVNLGEIEDKYGYLSIKGEDQKEIIKTLLNTISECEFTNVTNIDISDVYNISLTYDNRIVLELGNSTELDFKIKFAKQVIESGNITENDKGSLDLSLGRETNQAYYKSENLSH